jgi:hypothetical protein
MRHSAIVDSHVQIESQINLTSHFGPSQNQPVITSGIKAT